MKILLFLFSASLLVLGIPVQPKNFENNDVVRYIKNHQQIYTDLVNLISQNAELTQYIYLDKAGNKKIDFNALLTDSDSHGIIIQFLKNNFHHLNKRQIDFNDFLGSFMNVLNTFSQSIQISLQNSVQELISSTITDIFNRLQSSLFAGEPANLNDIMENFLNNLKNILTINILQSVNDTFKQQALSTMDLQFNELSSLVDKLKDDSVAPIEFINLLQQSLNNLQKSLSEFLPNISDLVMSQLIKLLDQVLKK